MNHHISICIPAYKRIDYLKRLLCSIEIQKFKDYEVIISDDSNDDSVAALLKNFNGRFEIKYFKNEKALGTPANDARDRADRVSEQQMKDMQSSMGLPPGFNLPGLG